MTRAWLTRSCAGTCKMLEQVGPASCMAVPFGDRGRRKRPGDVQVRIIMGDREVLGRVVWAVDSITDVGGLGECLESVEETRWDVQMPKFVVVKQKRLLPAERWRSSADIDHDIVHGSMSTANQFCFAAAAATVHATHDADPRTGLRVLHEGGRHTRGREICIENLRIEGAGEESSGVSDWLGCHHDHVGEVSCFDAHGVMLT